MLKKSHLVASLVPFFIGCNSHQTVVEYKGPSKSYNANKEIVISYDDYVKQYGTNSLTNNFISKSASNYISKKPNTNLIKNIQLKSSDSSEIKQALMEFYNEWKHVKYKFGGDSKKGIDCSAFIQKAFKDKFNLKIPRTTVYQVKKGQKISKSELQTGDLVFFKSRKHGRHVGIYVDNGEFMHASIKGIKFSKLNKNYYKKNYWTSRRVLN